MENLKAIGTTATMIVDEIKVSIIRKKILGAKIMADKDIFLSKISGIQL